MRERQRERENRKERERERERESSRERQREREYEGERGERQTDRVREEYTTFQSDIIIVTLNHFILMAVGNHHKLNKSDLIS